jgi:Putative heavy-metal chelation
MSATSKRRDRLLQAIVHRAQEAHRDGRLSADATTIRGVWNTSYVIELAEASSRLHLHYVVVQTVAQGCCYYEPTIETPGVSEALIGLNVLSARLVGQAWHIAALDAVFAELCREADDQHVISGSNIEKAEGRASLIASEVTRLLGSMRRPARVANIGVVGDVVDALKRSPEVEVLASDFYQQIVGRTIHGVEVAHGSLTPQIVADADVALVTGMTLANGTIDEIMDVAQANGTAVVVFAQTGAHFAELYCDLGVRTVISEPLPFYLTGSGPTTIDVFRA